MKKRNINDQSERQKVLPRRNRRIIKHNRIRLPISHENKDVEMKKQIVNSDDELIILSRRLDSKRKELWRYNEILLLRSRPSKGKKCTDHIIIEQRDSLAREMNKLIDQIGRKRVPLALPHEKDHTSETLKISLGKKGFSF